MSNTVLQYWSLLVRVNLLPDVFKFLRTSGSGDVIGHEVVGHVVTPDLPVHQKVEKAQRGREEGQNGCNSDHCGDRDEDGVHDDRL